MIAIIGVVIAGLSLYYTRMSVVGTQDTKSKSKRKARSVEVQDVHDVHEVEETPTLQPVVVQQEPKKRGNMISFDD